MFPPPLSSLLRRAIRSLAVPASVAVLALSVLVGPGAAAQEPTPTTTAVVGSTAAPDEPGDAAEVRISDVENERRIDQAVLALLIIAVGLAILTLLFWWHTQPQRRARALAPAGHPSEGTIDEKEDHGQPS